MSKCPVCGADIPDGEKICTVCGWKSEAEDRVLDEVFMKDNPFLKYLQTVMDTVKGELDDGETGIEGLPLDNDRWVAAASYLGPAFLYTYYVKGKDNELIKYHANQACLVFAFDIASNVLKKIPLIGKPAKKLCDIAAFALAFMGARKAVANKMEPVPYLGQLGIEILK